MSDHIVLLYIPGLRGQDLAAMPNLSRRAASDNSRPILERLGFTAVTTTTPYVWSPPALPGVN